MSRPELKRAQELVREALTLINSVSAPSAVDEGRLQRARQAAVTLAASLDWFTVEAEGAKWGGHQ